MSFKQEVCSLYCQWEPQNQNFGMFMLSKSYLFFPGKPTCRCPVGFSGPFCERRICDNYCLNGGTCDVTQGNQPVCRCMAEYTGDRCLYRESCTNCLVAANITSDHWCHVLGLLMIDISLSILVARTVTTKHWFEFMLPKVYRMKHFEVHKQSVEEKQSPKVLSSHKHHICLYLQIKENQTTTIKQPLGVSVLKW